MYDTNYFQMSSLFLLFLGFFSVVGNDSFSCFVRVHLLRILKSNIFFLPVCDFVCLGTKFLKNCLNDKTFYDVIKV